MSGSHFIQKDYHWISFGFSLANLSLQFVNQLFSEISKAILIQEIFINYELILFLLFSFQTRFHSLMVT